MEEPSNPNPEKLFQFTITPLTKFKKALDALIDRNFNSIGFGVIEVSKEGVDFSVHNIDTEVTGLLRLNSAALKDFYFNSKCKGSLMKINFRKILFNISDNDESITFSLFDGSYYIIIHLGNNPIKEFRVRSRLVPEFERFLRIQYVCTAIMPSNMLSEILDGIRLKNLQGISGLVSVNVTQILLKVNVEGLLLPSSWEYKFNDGVTETVGLERGRIHQAYFILPHLDVLRKASLLGPFFKLCFLKQPKEKIMTQFKLEELGSLMIVSRAIRILPNIERMLPYDLTTYAAACSVVAAATEPIL